MKDEKLILRKSKGKGNKVISIRMNEELLNQIDKIAIEADYSRNELILKFIEFAIERYEIKE